MKGYLSVQETAYKWDVSVRRVKKKKFKLYTRIAMKVVGEGGRCGFLTYLRG